MGNNLTYIRAASAEEDARDIRTADGASHDETNYPPSPSSSRSTSSSSAHDDNIAPNPTAPSRPPHHHSPMVGLNYPISPLERQYVAPTGELDVAAQLEREPLPRSLHSSLRRAAAGQTTRRVAAAEDDETRARKLADAKRELLVMAGQI
ncbi:hypothetical protein GGS23DRAFT_325404 [Durotheca rogersii]|uniref:uncharacterized protein n=1 Tax=Durotheca rogersii TaxID=419775 RepID=UPI00221EB0EF|nr:uncharacterized protein GGS23DRAFT_325404 [Durotheca rogersii]KAI5859392.1 hypothetical protein GGS23DRAFT_325404 [Durotheca rogersii]